MYGSIYQADLYCDKCTQALLAEVPKPTYSPPWDSDDYPSECDVSDEADCPQHCGSGEGCLDPIILESGWKVGKWLENSLTCEGVAYVQEAVEEGNGLVSHLWAEWYAEELDTT